jgi:glycosyltransferase involved in cell wall biosynthesis
MSRIDADDQPVVSVVIPTYQRRASVERAVRALSRQALAPHEYEVIVAIDGSTDGTRESLDAMKTPYALRPVLKQRGGRASACNAGLRIARGRVVVFLDDDMEATYTLLSAHAAAHETAGPLGVVGAVPIGVDATSSPVTRYVASRFNGHLGNLAAPGYQFGLRDFYSGNFSALRETLERVGGFDESFTAYGNEDLDLSVRLRSAGVRLIFSAEAVAQQHYEKDFPALARDELEKGRTAVQFATKHPAWRGELKLSQRERGPFLRRAARDVLLTITSAWPPATERVIQTVSKLGERNASGLRHVYPIVLDYMYWLGVRSAERDGLAAAQPATVHATGR